MSCTRAQRGMSWKESLELRASKTYPDNGYYLSNQEGGKANISKSTSQNSRKGSQDAQVMNDKARGSWIEQYHSALNQCSHAYW
ncbi:PREDICTED: uncharacterized protein LOC107335457 isoform X2 [Acropora digitifera]|uniref:uncharacterized protein LOC107335457 isoform X2 n=1 Tax=Acropora digitifera TaxID=70779 RepID=UPI00077AC650|nr:PREDICTED: uncharacterized protein LOC107335457 isoform X2 [Acropora digitifera]